MGPRWLFALPLGLLIACGGDPDDGDGGRLGVHEEVRVREWVREITPVIQQVSQIDWLSMDPSSVAMTMRQLERARPPMVRANQTDRALSEFHGALAQRAEAVIEVCDRMERSIGMLTDFDALFRRFEEMENSGTRVRNLASDLATALAPDFRDDAQFQADVQVMVNTTTRLFGSGFRRTRTLPSMATPGSSTRSLPSATPQRQVP